MRAGTFICSSFLASILFGLAVVVSGEEVGGLYEARVPVSSKDKDERDAALGTALLQVVIKVSGSRSPGASPVIGAALASPNLYVQQFRYHNLASQGADEAPADTPAFELWARFDPGVVDPLLREAGLPVWGRVRPSVLALVAVEGSVGRELLGAEDPGGWSVLLEEVAGQRGVPLSLPLMDLEDQARLRASDVWAGFEDNVRSASQRYQSEGVLLGSVYQVLPGAWEARWRLLLNDGRHEWLNQGDRLERVLFDGVQETADILASRFGGFTGVAGPSGVELTVAGINSLKDYARALHYLDSLDEISRVEVTRVETDSVSFRVDARGGREAVRQVIALGRTLTPEGQTQWDDTLSYRLLP